MKLKQVEIVEYKSIKNEKIDITTNQVCFVGINESGKTSILEAISYLNILDKTFTTPLLNKNSTRYPNGFPMVCGLFELSNAELTTIFDWIKKDVDSNFKLDLVKDHYVYLKRWGNGLENIKLVLSNLIDFEIDLIDVFKKHKSLFLDTFFNDLFPFIEIYKNEELLIEPATIEELKGNDQRFETFRRLLHIGGCVDLNIFNNEDTNLITTFLHNIDTKLNAIFKRHYRQDESINIRLNGFSNKLAIVIQDNSDCGFSINERSPGFQYYFAFLINKLFLNEIHSKRNVIYLLDEPGNNLHPKGAKDLLQTFNEVAIRNQIFYTTHNPFLAIRNNIDSLIFVNKTAIYGTKINKKPFLNKYQLLRKELGIMLNDSFVIGEINIIVEGNTEKLALHRLFHESDFIDLQWINIYNADGVNNISQALNYLGKNNLGLSGIVLLDSDSEAKSEQQKKAFITSMKEPNWELVEVNNIYKTEKVERTFEDLFPQKLYIDSFNDYCHSLKELSVFDKPYINFEYSTQIVTPIIKTLQKHFFTFIDPENISRNSITKQDIIRILLDKTDKMSSESKKDSLEKCFKLVELIKDKIKTVISHA